MRSCEIRMTMVGCVLSSVLLLALTLPAQAASKHDPDREAVRRAQLELRQMQDEKSALEQEKAKLSEEFEALKKKSSVLAASVASANRSKAAAEKEVEALRADQAKSKDEIERLKKELADSQTAERDTRNSLQRETGLKQRLEQNLSERSQALEMCDRNNKTLYQYHVELINLAQQRGTLDVLLESEPVLGFKRVQIENLLEKYRDKLDAQEIRTRPSAQAQAQ